MAGVFFCGRPVPARGDSLSLAMTTPLEGVSVMVLKDAVKVLALLAVVECVTATLFTVSEL